MQTKEKKKLSINLTELSLSLEYLSTFHTICSKLELDNKNKNNKTDREDQVNVHEICNTHDTLDSNFYVQITKHVMIELDCFKL